MAKQSLHDVERTRAVKVSGKTGSKPAMPKMKGIVNVAPYVRMVHGKPVYVAGYTYRRK